jgi:protein KRI1
VKKKEEDLVRELNEEDSSIDDEDAEKITKSVKEDFFRLLPLLHSKDKQIYDKNLRFFEGNKEKQEKGGNKSKEKKNQTKKFTIKDMEREMVLERIDQQENKNKNSDNLNKIDIEVLPYEKQQQELKKAFLSAVDEMDGGEEENDEILKPRKKSEKETQQFETDYQSWLREKKMDSLKDGEVLVKYWQDTNLNYEEKFLRE